MSPGTHPERRRGRLGVCEPFFWPPKQKTQVGSGRNCPAQHGSLEAGTKTRSEGETRAKSGTKTRSAAIPEAEMVTSRFWLKCRMADKVRGGRVSKVCRAPGFSRGWPSLELVWLAETHPPYQQPGFPPQAHIPFLLEPQQKSGRGWKISFYLFPSTTRRRRKEYFIYFEGQPANAQDVDGWLSADKVGGRV